MSWWLIWQIALCSRSKLYLCEVIVSVYQQKRGGVWYYQFQFRGQTYNGATGERQRGRALTVEANIKSKLAEGAKLPGLRKMPKLADHSKHFLAAIQERVEAGSLDRDTQRGYQNGCRLLGATKVWSMLLNEIGPKDCSVLKFPGGPSNANQALRTLSVILSHACESGYLAAKPRIPLRKEKKRLVIIERWLQDLILELSPPRLADVFTIMLDSGPRPEEVCRMRWEHVSYERNAITIGYGKSVNSRRSLGITDRMYARLKDLEAHKESPWLFPSRVKRVGHVKTVNKMWDETMVKVRAEATRRGLIVPDGLVLYSARHTFGTNLYKETKDAVKVMLALGHSDIKMTMRYVHAASAGTVREAMNEHNEKVVQMRKRA